MRFGLPPATSLEPGAASYPKGRLSAYFHMEGTNHMVKRFSICAALLLAAIAPASALTVDGGGNITDWGISPFPQTGCAPCNHIGWAPASNAYWMEENNYSRVNYPSGIGHQPSPGGSTGEHTDMEALYWRASGNNLQVLLAHSAGDSFYSSGWRTHYRVGDLFIDIDGGGFDFAVTSTNVLAGNRPWQAYDPATKQYRNFDHSAAPGSVYALDGDELVGIVGHNRGGYGDNTAIRNQTGPWAIDPTMAQLLGLADLDKASFDYGSLVGGGYYADDPYANGVARNENDTWFFEYTIPMDMLGMSLSELSTINLHISYECGNDYIGTIGGEINPPEEVGSTIPEPVTLAALSMGVASLAGYGRRRLRGTRGR